MRTKSLLVVTAVCCAFLGGGVASASTGAPIRLEGNGLGVVSFGASIPSATRIAGTCGARCAGQDTQLLAVLAITAKQHGTI